MDKPYPIEIPPGLWKNGTKYQAKGRWYDANLVRFYDRTIRPVGGWRRVQDDAGADLAALSGVPRAAKAFRTDTSIVQAVGTVSKLYVVVGGVLHDVTPVGFPAGRTTTGYATASGAYNVGPYGSGYYGQGSQTAQLAEATTWQLDNFGNDLVAVATSDEKLYLWAGDPGTPAAVPSGAPTSCVGVVVTPERFLVALGTDGDVRQIAWASQETSDDWTPSDTNTAGDFRLATNGRLLAGRRTEGETLLFTDADVHKMTYIGGTFVYSFRQIGENCGLLAPNAVVTTGSVALWMAKGGFYKYDGFVAPLRCDVEDYVFGDFNEVQAAKCWGMSVSTFNEAWWFYPSKNSDEIDRYVVYNYAEDHWTVGQLARTAGFDRGAVENPVMLSVDGKLYEHEIDPSLSDARGGVAPYVESGPMELGDGERVMQVQRFIPDAVNIGDVALTVYTADAPAASETATAGPFPLTALTDLRVAARQARFRIAEVTLSAWRVGQLRFSVVESSRR